MLLTYDRIELTYLGRRIKKRTRRTNTMQGVTRNKPIIKHKKNIHIFKKKLQISVRGIVTNGSLAWRRCGRTINTRSTLLFCPHNSLPTTKNLLTMVLLTYLVLYIYVMRGDAVSVRKLFEKWSYGLTSTCHKILTPNLHYMRITYQITVPNLLHFSCELTPGCILHYIALVCTFFYNRPTRGVLS